MKLFYFIRDDTACTYYRQHIPFREWGKHDEDLILASYNRNTILKDMENIIVNAEILHVQRGMEKEFAKVAEHRRKDGHLTVVDHDDNLFALSPLSPHYKDFGVEEITVKLPDNTIMKLWEDGKNIDLKANKQKQEDFKKVLGAVDLLTVTTPYLAEVYKPYCRKIEVLPNCIDGEIWEHRELADKPKETRIYWSGGASHYDDWAMINKPLKKVLDNNENIKLVILGQKFSGTLKEMDMSKVEHHPWVHYEAYPYKTIFMQPTFCIIPLEATEFARGKSPIKWIEQAALGIPCVTSFTPPYDLVYEEGNGIFIKDNDPDLWIQGMQMLIDDPLLRAKLGGEAKRYVLANYDIRLQWHKWKTVFEEIMK